MSASWRLSDAEEHRAAPDTALEPGDLAKLVFELIEPVPECGAERMWVEVREVSDTVYRGELINEPLHVMDLRCGDVVEFEARHVAATASADDAAPVAVAAVNKRVTSGAFPGRLIHSTSDPSIDDAFWYVFVGDESAAERGSGATFDWRPLVDLVDSFPPMAEVFESGTIEGYWDWSESDGRYVRHDFPGDRQP